MPAAEQRHATKEQQWRGADRCPTLCEQELVPEDSVLGWLWETCPVCNAEAHRLAGVPMAGAP
ncbi:zinc finger protein [Saccharopolyspora cebuensis]|uniref:Zinc finger protein n=1 Tax=Saccharopolyspora cebuensis TaxID=418759 RepID=A0ABV4CJQ1_9PSEU